MTTSRRIYLTHLDWALTADPEDRQLRDATLVVEGDRILAVGPTEAILAEHPPAATDDVRDSRRYGVTPGFVDTHVHLSETLSRAVFPDNLATRAWVFHWAKPFYAHVSESDESVSVTLGTTEMLRCGTTCFLDMGAQNDPGPDASGRRRRHPRHHRPPRGRQQAHPDPGRLVGGDGRAPLLPQPRGGARGARAVRARLERLRRRAHPLLGQHRGQGAVHARLHVGARALAERLGVGTTYHIA
ncbi:MAG: amidohydrolase family protein [Solirubrobacterales bacterium]